MKQELRELAELVGRALARQWVESRQRHPATDESPATGSSIDPHHRRTTADLPIEGDACQSQQGQG